MANNNAFNAQGAGLTSQTSAIDNSVKNTRDLNPYDLSYNLYMTSRFGILEPTMFYDAIAKENVTYRSAHQLRTYTMSSPLLNGVQQRLDSFRVPYACILEHGWQYINSNPVSGNDIDFVKVNSVLSPASLVDFFNLRLRGNLFLAYDNNSSGFNQIHSFFATLSLLDTIISGVGLAKLADIELDIRFKDSNNHPVEWEDLLYKFVDLLRVAHSEDANSPVSLTLTDNNTSFNYSFDLSTVAGLRRMFEFFNHEFIFGTQPEPNYNWGPVSFERYFIRTFFEALGYTSASDEDFLITSWPRVPDSFDGSDPSKYYVNIYRLVAYQLAVAQFYTNDSVDPVNTAHKWHNNMMSIASAYGVSPAFFDSAGVRVLYDSISGYYIDKMLTNPVGDLYTAVHSYLLNIFGFQRALKFGDYFTTSKLRPYAVGNSEIVVDTNNVNGIDLTRSLLVQRFLNACNRIGNNALEFAKRMGGTLPTTRDAQPYFLSSTTYNIDGFEVENTSDNQGNVTTNLKSYDNRFAFETFVDEESVLLSIRYTVSRPCYFKTLNKHNSHIERFDYFTPMLQDLGNISLSMREIEPISCFGALAYKPVYSEYRETRDVGTRAFTRSNLKSWVLDTPIVPHDAELNSCPLQSIISSNFFRYRSTDFDQFYSQISGIGCEYYHFIMRVTNYISSRKPVSDTPKLLF